MDYNKPLQLHSHEGDCICT